MKKTTHILAAVSCAAIVMQVGAPSAFAAGTPNVQTVALSYFGQIDRSIVSSSALGLTSKFPRLGTNSHGMEHLEVAATRKLFRLAGDKVDSITPTLQLVKEIASTATSQTYEVVLWNEVNWTAKGKVGTSGSQVTHTLTFTTSNGQWALTSDKFTDPFLGVNSTKPSASQTNVSSLQVAKSTFVSSGPAQSNTSIIGGGTYDPSAAVAYANKYVYHGATGQANYDSYYNNAQYYDYNSVGGDCASFVSQALVAGGMGEQPGVWYYDSSSPLGSSTTHSWYVANDLHNFWASDTTDFQYIGNQGTQYAQPGDVIYLANAYGHSEIVDAVTGGTVYIDCHDYDAYNYPATYYNGSTAWYDYRPLS